MASSGSRVISLTELNSIHPTLRLTLTNKASQLAAEKPHNPAVQACLGRAKTWAANMFQEAEENIKIENSRDDDKTKMNKERLKLIFDKMRAKLDQQEAALAEEMDGLTNEQQEYLLTYWQGVQTFFFDLFEYLKKAFDYVLEKIIDGYTIVKEAIKGFFEEALNFLKLIF